MNKKQITILGIAAGCILLLICFFTVGNHSLDYEKTVVVDDRPDVEILSNTNFDAVKDVKLQELPAAVSIFDTYQLQFWDNDKLLLRHTNPLFKPAENMTLVRDMSSSYSYLLKPDFDFSNNGLYLMNPDNGKTEHLIETNPYNCIRFYLSPDRTEMLIYEAYSIIGADGIRSAERSTKSDYVPFTVEGYGNIRDRIRLYDFNTKDFSTIDEWDSKYFFDEDNNGKKGMYNVFNDLSWSTDGKGIVYCLKTARDKYKFKIFDLEKSHSSEYTMEERDERFEYVVVHAISKDLKKIWFSGVSGFMENNLEFDMTNAKSAIYLLDLNKQNTVAEKLVKNMVFSKVLSDENTIIYADELNDPDFTFKLYQYDMSKKQSKLIGENVFNTKFELSKDEKKLAYLSADDNSFELNMIEINSDSKPEKILLYKSGPDLYTANGLSWNNDGSKVAVSYYIDNGTLNHSGQICVLTLKE
ncbi:MAG: hypothetical protein APF77_20540 [Clostridia bacterium BRH_c25]|nr:MAG: hypothetical protein APF77_20540 [Clostridia bacterium BRH_c25]